MNMKSDNYNLLEEKWIPVLRSNGKFDHVGIYTALNEADRIRCIAAGNPMDRMAILRFLLAYIPTTTRCMSKIKALPMRI